MSDELLAAINQNLIDMKEDVASLKSDMKSLVGNGKPGRIDKLEDEVESLQAAENKRIGFTGAFGLIFTGWEVFKHFWKVS